MRLIVALLAAAGLAGAGCGSPEAPTILDTEKIERAIEHSSLTQRGQLAGVSCPSGVLQKKGLAFSCTAVVRRARTRFVIEQLDSSGHVRYEGR